MISLFGLAPCGVLPAIRVATDAVRSYRTFSPLPTFARWALRPERATAGKPSRACPTKRVSAKSGGIFSVPLVLRVAPTGRYPAHCPAEFGLSSRLSAGDHPALCDISHDLTFWDPAFGSFSLLSPAGCPPSLASFAPCFPACHSLPPPSTCPTRSHPTPPPAAP